MKNRIMIRMTLFLYHVFHLDDDALAKEVLEEERRLHLKGLWAEGLECLRQLDISLEDLVSMNKSQFKQKVKESAKELNKYQLLQEMMKLKKLDYIKLKDEEFEMKKYFQEYTLEDARTKFAVDTEMLRSVKMLFSSDPEFAADLWSCEAGCGRVESLRHIQVCPGYAEHWDNRSKDNTLDTIHYLQDVVMARMGLTDYK